MPHQRLLTVLTLFCLALAAWMVLPLPALAAGPVVTTGDDENDGCAVGGCSLREAIAAAATDDTITFAGSYPTYLNSTLSIDKRLTIDGETHAITVSGDTGNNGDRNVQVFNIGSSGVVTLAHLSIVSGTAASGGGIHNKGALTVQNSTLSGNSANVAGGGIHNNGALTVLNSTLSGNSAAYGGGIDNWGTLTVLTSTLSGSSADDGSGIFNGDGGTLTVLNSTLSGNSATQSGGGIANDGTLTVLNSTLSGNSANAGGGIFNEDGTLTVLNSTLSGNSADVYGGGLANWDTLTVLNSTLSGNSANAGGGIANNDTLTVLNSTLSGNSATQSGGGIHNYGALNLTNTIIANSPSGGDCRNYAMMETNDHNLIESTGDDACGLSNGVNGNITGLDPLLAALGGYGGGTQTLALLPGSPALDAGNTTACANPATINNLDQRGVARPQPGSGGCDIGAFESRGFSLSKTGGDGQSAAVNTAFANPLVLTVAGSGGEPVEGGQVVFSGPQSGAGLTPHVYTATVSGGAASQTVRANSIEGSYVVTGTTRGNLGQAISYTLVNTAGGGSARLYLPLILN